MFPGESLPQVNSPLDKNDHPELDNSELASDDLITKFMHGWPTPMDCYPW